MLTTGSVLHSVFEIYIYVISYWLGKWYSNSWVWSEAVKRGPYSRRRALFFPIRTDLGKHIACLFYMLFLFICLFFFSIKMIFIRNGFVYVTLLLNQFICRTFCLIPRPRYLALVKWFWVRWIEKQSVATPARLPRMRHQNQFTPKDCEKALQEKGNRLLTVPKTIGATNE